MAVKAATTLAPNSQPWRKPGYPSVLLAKETPRVLSDARGTVLAARAFQNAAGAMPFVQAQLAVYQAEQPDSGVAAEILGRLSSA
jgi:hypothetical protein